MDVDSLDQETVVLLPQNFTSKQAEDMTLFTITRSVLENATPPQMGITMKITMKRKIMSEMMTTYFPSFLLMMITYATTFFKPFFFDAALSVNLTTMLVMTTIFISKMEGLPLTSKTKMIDYWLIFCQLVPFSQVVLLTAIECLRDEEQQKEEKREADREDTRAASIQFGKGTDGANGSKTREAWDIPEKKTRSIAPSLIVIGKLDYCPLYLTS